MPNQLVWFRNDLRLADQPALAAAAAKGPVAALYVLDDETPGKWRIGGAQRWWLHHSLTALAADLAARGGRLILRRGPAGAVVPEVAAALGAQVHTLRHHEPWAKRQEAEVAAAATLHAHDGALLAPPETVRSKSGGRYRIFTPYWKTLRQMMPPVPPEPVPTPNFAETASIAGDRLEDWALLPTRPNWAARFGDDWTPGEAGALARLAAFTARARGYDQGRNRPAEEGSSRLSPHLAMGEISPRQVWHAVEAAAGDAAEPYQREIGWRDFATNIVDQFPTHGEEPGRPLFARFGHRAEAAELKAWQQGRTGYPIVDAGMRQLWISGWMHNRVRMIAASFLVKHLLIDWRVGQAFFWDTLVDADYGNNSLGWQWVMGSGVDSSPFNRIFAPVAQSAKFDAAGYIRRWVPELAALPDAAIHAPWEHEAAVRAAGVVLGRDYPMPLVGHGAARQRALAAFAAARGTA